MESYELLDDERSEMQKRIVCISNIQDRLRHFVIDFILIVAMTIALRSIILSARFDGMNHTAVLDLVALSAIYFSYFVFLEFQFGLTIGKYFNKTRVVNEEQEKPNLQAVIIRAIIRPIPFQFILRLLPFNRTLHDYLSKTWVVRIH